MAFQRRGALGMTILIRVARWVHPLSDLADTMKISIVLSCLLLAIGPGLVVPVQAQQSYPSKPIHLVSPYPSGGSVTLVARIIADKLSENLGQPIVIDNKPGASTSISSEFVMRAPPDRYTLLLAAAPW